MGRFTGTQVRSSLAEELAATAAGGTPTLYGYDQSGRRISETTGVNTRGFGYDPAGELTATTTNAGVVARGLDPSGLPETVTGPDGTTFLDWAPGGELVSLTRPAQGIATLTRPGGDEAWSTMSQGTTTRAVTSDIYRSTLANTGGVGTAGSYGPYGQPQGTPTTGSVTVGYRGEVVIGGLTFLRARDYDPTSGTFTTTDPVPGFPGAPTTANPYAYVNNNPINTTDPTGQFAPPGFTAGLWGSVDNGALGGFGQTVSSLWNNRTVYRAVLATGASKAAGWVTDHKETILIGVATVAATVACGGVTGFACGAAVFAAAGGINGAIDHCGNGNSATECATGIITNAVSWGAFEIAGYGAFKLAGKTLRPALTRIAASETVTALTSKTASRLAQRGQTGAIRLTTETATSAATRSGVYRLPQSGGAATSLVFDRVEAAVLRHGGQAVESGYIFPSRRVARQAASEITGDLGSRASAIRASEFRCGPYWMQNSDRVIGRRSFDNARGWRDDFIGHPHFGMGPHVNIWIDGIDQSLPHLFY